MRGSSKETGMSTVNPAVFSTQAKFADEQALLADLVASADLLSLIHISEPTRPL